MNHVGILSIQKNETALGYRQESRLENPQLGLRALHGPQTQASRMLTGQGGKGSTWSLLRWIDSFCRPDDTAPPESISIVKVITNRALNVAR
jgi:hypothetical protein